MKFIAHNVANVIPRVGGMLIEVNKLKTIFVKPRKCHLPCGGEENKSEKISK